MLMRSLLVVSALLVVVGAQLAGCHDTDNGCPPVTWPPNHCPDGSQQSCSCVGGIAGCCSFYACGCLKGSPVDMAVASPDLSNDGGERDSGGAD